MKWLFATLAIAVLWPITVAFPVEMMELFKDHPKMTERTKVLLSKRQAGADAATLLFEPFPNFDKASQHIDVSPGSGHEWRAPGPNDLRGPCPGLNAFANHGFLPHNGYATVAQYIEATTTVVGMGADLATFLALLGALIDSGDLTAWSMGGTPPPGVGSPFARVGKGLIGSHNKYENDVSPTRPDLYESGNNYITSADQFQDMINASPGGFVTLDSLVSYRSQRFDRQKANNPYFFNAPFPGLATQSAAFTFIYRFMANHSAESPVGTLNYATLQSWFGIEGTNGSYRAPFGYERIPENWYRRSQLAPYTIGYFLADTVAAALLHPKFLSIGGNLGGKPGNFAGVDASDLTGGLFRSADLLKGNNLGCFVFQTITQVQADILLAPLLRLVQTLVGNIVTQLSCPKLINFNAEALKIFPGYTRSLNEKREIVAVRRNGELG